MKVSLHMCVSNNIHIALVFAYTRTRTRSMSGSTVRRPSPGSSLDQ